jgi:hypothetical protein
MTILLQLKLISNSQTPALLIGSAIAAPVPVGHENECRPARNGSALRPARARSFRDPRRLQWKGDSLLLDGRGRAVVRIAPDKSRAGMWRVELPDGRLSDMVNRTRAKDAAISLACAALGQREAVRPTP